TNGSRLNEELNKLIADNFDSIGFSVDSLNEQTNTEVGRIEKNKSMNIGKVLDDIGSIRDLSSSIDIKINTVVSSLNKSENLSSFIDRVKPNKWKVFKVLPVKTSQYNVSESDFLKFLDRHKDFAHIISSEDNDEMTDSYLMIDPVGRFFQNSSFGEEYNYSRPIIEIGIDEALKEIEFNAQKFHKRYENKQIKLVEVM
ncbi:viperin family antiviral radical SAM protein, partial [Psychrobacter sp. 1U2]